MLILIAVLIIGALLLARSPRLECASDVHVYVEEKKPVVRAYVDGKPVKSHLME